MHYRKFISLCIATACYLPSFSQMLPHTAEMQSAVAKHTRTITGKPGSAYWQNSGDYDIHVNFNPANKLLSGEEMIVYSNNSPDTLKRLIIRLYPDLYKKHTARVGTVVADKDENDGVTVEELSIGTESLNVADPKKANSSGTNLIVRPGNAILPHSKINLKVKWHYIVNTGSQVRTGMVDSGSYFIAYFFPRLAVYDDMDGWDDWSYNGLQEFYNDFGNFNVEIKVPFSDVVWATGERIGEEANLGPAIMQKLQRAKRSDEIVHIIDSADYKNQSVINSDNTGIWRFKATNISDFAFALSDHYVWDASTVMVDSVSKRKTLVSSAYNTIHKDYFDVANQAHQSVYYMSHLYPKVPFPFPQITIFDGTDQMEYPMMVNDNPTETHKDAVQLTSHEIFHSYFPFYMGINETQYAWMDEGWATIGESVISPLMGEPEDEGIYSKGRYERISGTDKDMPLITNTKLYAGAAYLSNSYGKGGLCYWVLQDMLGDDLYFKALHQYMNDWHGKHPVPYDFFYSFNTATGKNLDWFWKKWFYEWVYPDLAISKVEQSNGAAKITIINKGGLPVPVYLIISVDKGEPKTIHFGADVWKDGKTEFVATQKFSSKIIAITLGNDLTPDKNEVDNHWEEK